MEEKSRRLREERERKATQRRLERYRKQDEVARQTWRPPEQRHSSSCKHRRVETEVTRLLEFTYLVFTRLPGESHRRQLRSFVGGCM